MHIFEAGHGRPLCPVLGGGATIGYDSSVLRVLMAIAIATSALHCAPRSTPEWTSPAPEGPVPQASLIGYEAHFHITWNGARIGDAHESLRAQDEGLRFSRGEHIAARRGDAVVHGETNIAIDTDAALRAERVALRQLASGAERRGTAERNARGDWVVRFADEPLRQLPGEVVPAELVPLRIAAAAQSAAVPFDGAVMLPGYGFAVAHLRVDREAPQRLLATLTIDDGAAVLRSRFHLAQNGTLVRIEGEDGSGSRRVDAAAAAEPFAPPEIVDSASIALAPPRPAGAGESNSLVLGPIARERPPPPPLPGQHIEILGDAWHVRLGAGDALPPLVHATPYRALAPSAALDAEAAALAAEIVSASRVPPGRRAAAFALARATASLLADDLGTPGDTARTALMLGRGDCTAHALLFAELARARGIPARLVTGYRIDGARLLRHRWAIVALDGEWIAVDPTYGEAPAAPRLIGLAVHGPRAAELAMADEAAFAGLARVRAFACPSAEISARLCDPSSLRIP
ncbi:transglutaminase domain-containing protein [Haliangium ochraceum]|uniref:Transglutaminase domain protein n=1 Tax=Haliangium ochraceum (strain DSM 14365 / JCM 11303 / SMP-2) TaxID=502025 RepID=D0LG72_HALO1|nr:transglutaminase domain-containing protein [Haliangium ochraceum]ACY18097.1 transglutaminase domain protein [Haliangium ochraceum DSM 14365]